MLHVEWYHVCWPRLTAKRVEPVVSISWASCSFCLSGLFFQETTADYVGSSPPRRKNLASMLCIQLPVVSLWFKLTCLWYSVSVSVFLSYTVFSIVHFCTSVGMTYQMGEQIWVGHVGHGSVPVTRWPILHCTHPVSHVIFWFMENQQRQSKLLFWLSVSKLFVPFHSLCSQLWWAFALPGIRPFWQINIGVISVSFRNVCLLSSACDRYA